jgi:hypothetical protein
VTATVFGQDISPVKWVWLDGAWLAQQPLDVFTLGAARKMPTLSPA